MRFESLLCWRYLFSRRNKKLLHVVSLITILGVGFGVAALLVTVGVLSGFRQEYERSVLAFNSHVVVMSAEEIREPKDLTVKIQNLAEPGGVAGLIPFLYREGLAIHGTAVRGLAIKAIDMKDYWKLSGLPHQGFKKKPVDGLWIGKILWEGLGRQKENLRLRFPVTPGSAHGFRDLPIAGTFNSGMYDYDANFALVDLRMAQRELGFGEAVGGIEVWLNDPKRAGSFRDRLEEKLSFPYTVLTWRELNASLFHALKLERLVFVIIMGLLILVASFNIMGSLTMRILDRRGDIAILRAMGARWQQIRRTFFLQGLTLSSIGCVMGMILAGLILMILKSYSPLKLAAEVYFIDHVPVHWDPLHSLIVFGVALFFSWLASHLALLRLKRLSVVRALGEA